ncbi:MAG: HNH endonuclease, partial [Aeriscardovia sp.]|nr:HNH endonuclease [Aeriscardovia sp.]
PCDYPYVLHIDGNKENNDVTNLQWSDKQSNHSDES